MIKSIVLEENVKIPRAKTIICDIDGTLIEHITGPFELFNTKTNQKLLPGVKEKFCEWDSRSYNIILITGRRESMRHQTVEQLKRLGIFYDHLIMGVGGGQRVLINDLKPDPSSLDNPTAVAINLTRNQGLENVKI